jgi:hypothetical protein
MGRPKPAIDRLAMEINRRASATFEETTGKGHGSAIDWANYDAGFVNTTGVALPTARARCAECRAWQAESAEQASSLADQSVGGKPVDELSTGHFEWDPWASCCFCGSGFLP